MIMTLPILSTFTGKLVFFLVDLTMLTIYEYHLDKSTYYSHKKCRQV